MDIDVRVSQRRQPRDIGVVDGMPLISQSGQGRVDVTGVPQDDRVQDESECAELVFLAVAVSLT